MQKLASPGALIKLSLQTYFKKENLIYLTKIALIAILVPIVALLPFVLYNLSGLSLLSSGESSGLIPILPVSMSTPRMIIVGLSLVIGVVGSVVGGLWVQTGVIKAISQVVRGEIIGIRQTFKLAWARVWRFFVTGFLLVLIVVLGLILLVVPGVVFAVWFAFAIYIVVVEEKGVIESLKRSKALISGYFWPILGRFVIFFLYIFLIRVVVSLIPFVGPIVLALASPYFILLPYLLYEEIKRVKV